MPTPLIQHYDDDESRNKEYILIGLLFLFLLGMMIYEGIRTSNSNTVQMATEFEGTLIDKFQQRSDIYLQLNNRASQWKMKSSYNYDYEPKGFYQFIQEGDIIYKEKCSDKIYIKRNDKTYHFLIGDHLYNSTHRSKEDVLKYRLTRQIILEDKHCFRTE